MADRVWNVRVETSADRPAIRSLLAEAVMAQVFDESRPHPTGTIYYAKAWGI